MRFVFGSMLTATVAWSCAQDATPQADNLLGVYADDSAAAGATASPGSASTPVSASSSAAPTSVATGLPSHSALPATASVSDQVPAPSVRPPANSTGSAPSSPVASGPDGAGGAPAEGMDAGAGRGGAPDGAASTESEPTLPDEMQAMDAGSEQPENGDCPHSGNVSYHFNGSEGWPSDVVEKLTEALDEATWYYNCYSDLEKSITINYRPGVPTAEGNVDGVISFGDDRGYMQTATTMHEIGHTMGVAYFPWAELIADSRWTGAAVNEVIENLPAGERDPDMYSQRTYITCDDQHFWPYGLNQASEHQSEWSLINHVRIVAAMNVDKQNYIDTH